MDELTEEDLQDIVWGDHPDFKDVTKDSVDDTSRWHMYLSKVVRHVSGSFYSVQWQVGATEYQECDLDAVLVEVFPKEVTTTIYTTSKD